MQKSPETGNNSEIYRKKTYIRTKKSKVIIKPIDNQNDNKGTYSASIDISGVNSTIDDALRLFQDLQALQDEKKGTIKVNWKAQLPDNQEKNREQ